MSERIRISDDLSVDSSGCDFRSADNAPQHFGPAMAELVRTIKARRGWSSAMLGEQLDVDERTVRRWLAGDITPSLEMRSQLVGFIAPQTPESATTNPVVLATLIAGLHPPMAANLTADAQANWRYVDRALDLAAEIDKGIEVAQNRRRQANR